MTYQSDKNTNGATTVLLGGFSLLFAHPGFLVIYMSVSFSSFHLLLLATVVYASHWL